MEHGSTALTDAAAKRRAIGFLNWAHALDHYVILIFPTVVIGLEAVYGRPYSELIALGTASFVAFGVFSLPAGWLADRWSRRNMMAVFYIGCGLSLAGAALAPDLATLAAALFALGVFAAIYHPVGMAMLIDVSQARGRTLAFNGVCGNVGAALAAGITAALASWLGWRGAFVVPALACIATGIAYMALMPDDRHRTGKRQSAADVVMPWRLAAAVFGIYLVISIASGLVFNTVSIALPKIVDERLGQSAPLIAVGGLATAIFLCGAAAQLAMGRLVERYAPHLLFAGVVATQFLALLWAGQASGDVVDRRIGGPDGRHLRAGDGRRHRDRPLHGRCLAGAHLRGALLPHLRLLRRGGRDHRVPARPRRLRSRAHRYCGDCGGAADGRAGLRGAGVRGREGTPPACSTGGVTAGAPLPSRLSSSGVG